MGPIHHGLLLGPGLDLQLRAQEGAAGVGPLLGGQAGSWGHTECAYPSEEGGKPRRVAEAGPIPQQCSKGMGKANKHGRRRWGGPWPDLSGPEQGQGPASVWALRAAPGHDILGWPWPLLFPQPVRNLPGTSAS